MCYLRATHSQPCPDRYTRRISEDARTNAVFLVLVNAHAWNMKGESGPLNSHVVAPQALLLPLLEHELEKERNCEYCLSQHATLTVKCTMGLNALIPAFLISRAIAKQLPSSLFALVDCAYQHALLSSTMSREMFTGSQIIAIPTELIVACLHDTLL